MILLIQSRPNTSDSITGEFPEVTYLGYSVLKLTECEAGFQWNFVAAYEAIGSSDGYPFPIICDRVFEIGLGWFFDVILSACGLDEHSEKATI